MTIEGPDQTYPGRGTYVLHLEHGEWKLVQVHWSLAQPNADLQVFVDTSPPIKVRIGVHAGDAVYEADDFFGTAVNYAARVASQALGGELLVSSVVRELAGGAGPGFAFLEGRDVELKGLDGLHRIYALDVAAPGR